ncbi:hypothetical protein V6N13_016366 [Hibiscus sabdariffa]
MANSNVFFMLSLHVLFLVLGFATRSLHSFSVIDRTFGDEMKVRPSFYESDSFHRQHSPQLSTIASDMSTTIIELVEQQDACETNHEFMRLGSGRKRTLIEEGKKAIKASMERNVGNPLESKRQSPGGPDPHHH